MFKVVGNVSLRADAASKKQKTVNDYCQSSALVVTYWSLHSPHRSQEEQAANQALRDVMTKDVSETEVELAFSLVDTNMLHYCKFKRFIFDNE